MRTGRAQTTMADVAREAGVSVMTVSRVLRGVGGYVEAVEQRVRAAATRLAYRPDPLVGALMAARRRNRPAGFHGVIAGINTLEAPVAELNVRIRSLWAGAQEQAARSGFRLEEFRCGPDEDGLRRLLRVLRSRGVPGIFWLHFRIPGTRLALDLRHFACAAYGFSLEQPALHRASNFQLQSMQTVLEELLRRGVRRAGYVTFRQAEARVHRQWAAAWMEYRLHGHGVEWLEPLVLDVEAFDAAREDFCGWLRRERPEVVVSSFGDALEWIEAAGVAVPRDAGFVLLDAEPGGRVSGIDQQWGRIGAAGVDLITGQLARNERGIPECPKLTVIDGLWHPGRTLPRRFGGVKSAGAAQQKNRSARGPGF